MFRKIYTILFFLGLFFFSFNEYEGIPLLGEFKTESGAIFLFLGFLVVIMESLFTKKIYLPYKSFIFQLIFLFLIWCLISTLLNGTSVIENYFKHTNGINRFIRQYFALCLSCIFFFLLYWNVLLKMDIKTILFSIRKVFLLSLIVAAIYGFLEILVTSFGMSFLFPILKLLDYLPFIEVSLHQNRISSIAYEPPFLAIYLITIAGWMFSYVLTEKGFLRFVPMIVIMLLTFFSGSRTGLVVVFLQLLLFAFILYKYYDFKRYIVYSFFVLISFSSILLILNREKVTNAVSDKIESLDFRGNLKNNVSNQSRFGMQYASLKVFSENPFIGVGFGQQVYYNRIHYPIWATNKNYEFELFYKNKNERQFPPGYNIYTRILAETGLIGFMIFISLIYFSIKKANYIIKNSSGEKKILSVILLISLTGLFINWLQIDTFRMYGVWLFLAILIKVSQDTVLKHE